MNSDTVVSLKPFLHLKESKERMKPADSEAFIINKLAWTATTHLEVVEPGKSESRCLTVETEWGLLSSCKATNPASEALPT